MPHDAEQLPAALRRERIIALIAASGFVRVAELSREFGVSEVTVRSDLDAIEREHPIDRVHGGAVMRGSTVRREEPFEAALASAAEEKRRIGVAAAALVTSGSSILLDVGTTPAAVAAALLERDELDDVVVVTNSLTTALALEPAIPRFTVVVTGGTLRPLQHSLVAPYASQLLDELHVDLAFLGGTGVHPERGVTNVNLAETELKRRMLLAADRAVIVADASKLGVVDLGRIGRIEEFDVLVTSPGGPDGRDGLDGLAERGLEVVVA
ncbi:DeoR/GlpR family DNA-binding transcription regulator [Herbiconiux moechotypicola]|uniref:DeoR/GlpR family DNA-binding transcription regulator n=1 Tax=Herbiconiux moechotypicola TaxID=637393 RepID=A0ABN3DQF2_9MICO|nr:DeoR/GlpR family DNA-binding transcription regulator [Herbiconiux moechotypicola]MCS5731416.1 DeoR/GlpR family DNA-binding transcription regulator [Herbiconiux moechotypicola]